MKFSIVIPVFNVEDYIEECLNSIINNFDQNEFEIVCIDDASTDRSVEIIKYYQNNYPNINLYQNITNKGVAFSRNIGIKVAKGEFIWFVDSDDQISANALSILSEEINRENPDVICFNADIFGPSIRASFISEKYKSCLRGLNSGRKSVSPFFLITNLWICCIRKEFLNKNDIRFPEDLIVFEDWVFLWKLASCSPSVTYLDMTLYNYRVVVKNSLTKSYREGKEDISIFDVWYRLKNELILSGKYSCFEQFCLIRANDIFYHFFHHRQYSYLSYKRYCLRYSQFLKEIHNDLFRYIINDYPKEERKLLRVIRENPGKIVRIFITRKSRLNKSVIKLIEHFKLFSIPFINIFNWFKQITLISFYLVRIMFLFILNFRKIIDSFFL